VRVWEVLGIPDRSGWPADRHRTTDEQTHRGVPDRSGWPARYSNLERNISAVTPSEWAQVSMIDSTMAVPKVGHRWTGVIALSVYPEE
jgi:hypothetical protein